MNNSIIGIDLAKNTFQICALSQNNQVNFNRQLSRKKLSEFMQQQEPIVVAMEACGSSHYWGRKFEAMGHQVRLIPAQHVKPFVKGNKNDRNDAVAICEASQRPNMRFVALKAPAQQDLQMLHRIRQMQVKHVTAIANQIRGYLAERGIVFRKQLHHLVNELPTTLETHVNELTPLCRQLIQSQYETLLATQKQVQVMNQQIAQFNQDNAYCQRLQALPGYGPILSSARYAAVGNGSQFYKGRQLSAWIGLTPAHFGTGGKNTTVDTTKRGDNYLRTLLIHGARTVVTWRKTKNDPLSRWIQRLEARRGKRNTYVALANKFARAAWRILQGETDDLTKIATLG